MCVGVCLNVNNTLAYLQEFHIGLHSGKKKKQIQHLPIYIFSVGLREDI